LKEKSYTYYFLFIEIDTYHIDVNVHTTKSEIKFDDEREVFSLVLYEVCQALVANNLTPALVLNAYVKIISNLSDPPVHKWSVQVVGGKVTFPTGRGYSYQSIKVKTQVDGMDTRVVRDDVYEITGRSQTEFNSGLTITLNTESPLVKKVACPWISDGKLKIKINDRVLYLDYGFPTNGQCDNKALLIWNNGNNQRVILL
jgi:hypothetical protein